MVSQSHGKSKNKQMGAGHVFMVTVATRTTGTSRTVMYDKFRKETPCNITTVRWFLYTLK